MKGPRQLFALAENYPDLKAGQGLPVLQTELGTADDRIQGLSGFSNANVRDCYHRLQCFPSHFVAGTFRFLRREVFEIENLLQHRAPRCELDIGVTALHLYARHGKHRADASIRVGDPAGPPGQDEPPAPNGDFVNRPEPLSGQPIWSPRWGAGDQDRL